MALRSCGVEQTRAFYAIRYAAAARRAPMPFTARASLCGEDDMRAAAG